MERSALDTSGMKEASREPRKEGIHALNTWTFENVPQRVSSESGPAEVAMPGPPGESGRRGPRITNGSEHTGYNTGRHDACNPSDSNEQSITFMVGIKHKVSRSLAQTESGQPISRNSQHQLGFLLKLKLARDRHRGDGS